MLLPRETVVVKGGELAGYHGTVVDVSRHRVLVAFDPALLRKPNGTQAHGGGVVSFTPTNLRLASPTRCICSGLDLLKGPCQCGYRQSA